MYNVDWETLLTIYVEIKKFQSEDQKTISSFSKKKLDDWFRGLDNSYQDLLLNVLLP